VRDAIGGHTQWNQTGQLADGLVRGTVGQRAPPSAAIDVRRDADMTIAMCRDDSTNDIGHPSGQSMPALSAPSTASMTCPSSAPITRPLTVACSGNHSIEAIAVPVGSAARSTPIVLTPAL
jgi:hypothetical protein